MNESYVATLPQSEYPEYRGRKSMPASEGGLPPDASRDAETRVKSKSERSQRKGNGKTNGQREKDEHYKRLKEIEEKLTGEGLLSREQRASVEEAQRNLLARLEARAKESGQESLLEEAARRREQAALKPEREKPKPILATSIGSSQVEIYPGKDGRYTLVGFEGLTSSQLKKILTKAGIKGEIPEDFHNWNRERKVEHLKRHGVDTTLEKRAQIGAVTPDDDLRNELTGMALAGRLAIYRGEIERSIRGGRTDADKMIDLTAIKNQLVADVISGTLTGADVNVGRVRDLVDERLFRFEERVEQVQREAEARQAAAEGRTLTRRVDPQYEVPTRNAIDQLVRLAAAGTTAGPEWDQHFNDLSARIARIGAFAADAANPQGYGEASHTARAASDALQELGARVPVNVGALLNELTTDDAASNLLRRLGRNFQRRFDRLSLKEQADRYGDIDREANTFRKQILSGFGYGIEVSKAQLLALGVGDAMREWRAVTSAESLESSVRIEQLTEGTVHWREIPQKLASIYNFVENTPLTVDDLQGFINKAILNIGSIPPDEPEGREMREAAVAELEALRGVHSWRITMEKHDMNPEPQIGVFQTYFDDETWSDFISRFGRDERLRNFLDREGNAVNLLDKSFAIYSERLRQERVRMNIVEEMTRHAINNPLGGGDSEGFRKWLGLDLDSTIGDAGTPTIRDEIERLRLYFKRKIEAKIASPKNPDLHGKNVDDIWGRKNAFGPDSRTRAIDVTHDVIEDWHTKETIQGAFGFVGENDWQDILESADIRDRLVADLTIRLERVPTNDEINAEAKKEFVGKTFLKIRQNQLREQLSRGVAGLGLKVNVAGEGEPVEYQNVDVDYLRTAGFLDSVNLNAYNLAWMFEWSNYDSIRIYSRDSTSYLDDDFERIVYHKNTNMFYGRQVEHIWEYYHDDNENRGRAKENDVNRIWKQKLPGKHHYLFPQNSLMVRWWEYFATDEQKEQVRRRTLELMREYDFDDKKLHDEYYRWMRSVAVMDMIEEGKLSFGQGEGLKLSDIVRAEKIKKFEMIDLFVDRKQHVGYLAKDAFQSYLANPLESKFKDINDKEKVFYSTRNARQHPWMSLAVRCHWEVTGKHNLRLFTKPNLSSASMETMVDTLIAGGHFERAPAEKEKKRLIGFAQIGGRIKIGEFVVTEKELVIQLPKLFGTTPFRRARQSMESVRRVGWLGKFTLFGALFFGFLAGLVELGKQIPKSATDGLGGGR